MNLSFRKAEENDCGLILFFVKELAVYEKLSDQVIATEDLLREWLFEKKKAEVIFACEDGREVGLPCSSTIFPPSSAEPESTLKIFMFWKSSAAEAAAGHC
jgi:hypothetical protein